MSKQEATKVENPFPQFVVDEALDITVENQRHFDWQAGFDAAKKYYKQKLISVLSEE